MTMHAVAVCFTWSMQLLHLYMIFWKSRFMACCIIIMILYI